MNIIRLLGAAQLIVFTASLVSNQTLKSIAGSASGSKLLAKISEKVALVRASNLIALVNSLVIIILGVLTRHLNWFWGYGC